MTTPRLNRPGWRTAARRERLRLTPTARRMLARQSLAAMLEDPRLAIFSFVSPADLGRERFDAFSASAKLAIEVLPDDPAVASAVGDGRNGLLEREGIVLLGLSESELLAQPPTLVEFLLALLAALTEPAPIPPDAC